MGTDDKEPVEQVDGGFGGAIGGGLMKVKSSSSTKGASEDGFAKFRVFRSPMKSRGGGTKVCGGGGGAIEGGGGGTNTSPSTRSGTDITDPLER